MIPDSAAELVRNAALLYPVTWLMIFTIYRSVFLATFGAMVPGAAWFAFLAFGLVNLIAWLMVSTETILGRIGQYVEHYARALLRNHESRTTLIS